MTDNVKLVWVSGIKDKEERESFKKRLLSNQDIWEKLEKIIVERIESLEPDIHDYDSPSWAYRQAHVNGKREALLDLLDIIP